MDAGGNQTILILKTPTKTYKLQSGLHLVGTTDQLSTIHILDESIDSLHALLYLTPDKQIIMDLQSKRGTYFVETKTNLCKAINKTEIPKSGTIKFGNILCTFNIILPSDSGIESHIKNISRNSTKNASDIIESSPEREIKDHRYMKLLRNRLLMKNSITSTPNKLNKSRKESLSKEEVDEIEDDSFFVPETQNSKCNIERIDQDSLESKCTDEDIFSLIEDENIRKQALIMSKEDEFYVPETQQHFSMSAVENKLNAKNSDLNDNDDDNFFRIDTQNFEYSSTDKTNNDENDCSASENLFGFLSQKKNLKCYKNKKANHNSKLNDVIKTNDQVDDSNDIIMSELKWTERTDKTNHSTNINSNCSTPDNLVFLDSPSSLIKMPMPVKEEIKEEPISHCSNNSLFLNQFFASPQQVVSVSFKENNNSKEPEKNVKLNVTSSKSNEFIASNISSLTLTQKMDKIFASQDPELEATQLFVKPILSISAFKSSKKQNSQFGLESNNSVNLADDMEDIELTQAFVPPKSLASKKNVIKSGHIRSRKPETNKSYLLDKENNDEFLETQEFINPNSYKFEENVIKSGHIRSRKPETNKSYLLDKENNDEFLETTQEFINPNSYKFEENVNDYDEDALIPTQKFQSKYKADQQNSEDNFNINANSKKKIDLNTCTTEPSFIIPPRVTDGPQATDVVTPCKSAPRKCVSNKNVEFDFDICTPQLSYLKLPSVEELKKCGLESENNVDDILELLDSDSETFVLANEIKKFNNKEGKDDKLYKDGEKNNDYDFPDSGAQDLKLINKVKNLKDDKKAKKDIEKITKLNNSSKNIKQIKQRKNVRQKNTDDNKRKRHDKPLHSNEQYQITNFVSNERQSNNRKHKPEIDIEMSKKIEKTSTKKQKRSINPNDINDTTPQLRKSKRLELKKIAFTRVDVKYYKSTVEQSGAVIVDNPRDCDLLIANEVLRTCKFIAAIARGIPIISTKWLDDVKEADHIDLSWKSYILNDLDAEKKYNFNLKKSLEKANNRAIFLDYTFLITPSTKPPPQELKQIISCGGGRVIDNISLLQNDFNNFYIVSHHNDSKLWSDYKIYANFPIISSEGIILTVLQQQICFRNHKIG